MSTIYTLNGKVLKNSANDKWLIKVPPPPSFDSVTIGYQIWTSKNLAIDDGGEGIYSQTVNYGQGSVTEYYYTWDAAVRVASSIRGWHLPSTTEWDNLTSTIGGASTGGTKLKSTYGWLSGNGTDNYGFCALPPGRYNSYFQDQGYRSYFWTANEYSTTQGYQRTLTNFEEISSTWNIKSLGFSVRLVKDA